MTDFIQVMTTVAGREEAEKMARHLLAARLAACVQLVGPVTSFFWWQGRIDSAGEYLCIIKSSSQLYKKIEAAIKEIHPYEVPEILAVPVVAGGPEYLRWLATELA